MSVATGHACSSLPWYNPKFCLSVIWSEQLNFTNSWILQSFNHRLVGNQAFLTLIGNNNINKNILPFTLWIQTLGHHLGNSMCHRRALGPNPCSLSQPAVYSTRATPIKEHLLFLNLVMMFFIPRFGVVMSSSCSSDDHLCSPQRPLDQSAQHSASGGRSFSSWPTLLGGKPLQVNL